MSTIRRCHPFDNVEQYLSNSRSVPGSRRVTTSHRTTGDSKKTCASPPGNRRSHRRRTQHRISRRCFYCRHLWRLFRRRSRCHLVSDARHHDDRPSPTTQCTQKRAAVFHQHCRGSDLRDLGTSAMGGRRDDGSPHPRWRMAWFSLWPTPSSNVVAPSSWNLRNRVRGDTRNHRSLKRQ